MTPSDWKGECSRIREHFLSTAGQAASAAELEALKVKCLGRKGELTELLKALKDFSLEDKKALGPAGNALKEELSSLFDSRAAKLQQEELNASLLSEKEDVTLPPYPFPSGRLHPLNLAMRRMTGLLMRLGFAWADGPFVETERYNFDALNIPQNHPARDMQDTFYLNGPCKDKRLLLRTHTSSVQIRHMEGHQPPLRIISPGRVFRNDALDASHSPVFHQIEGFYVDKNVSMADLKGTLTSFMRGLFGPQAKIRFRPSYFPFVEPGVEVDATCRFCSGKERCPVCKSTGWLEMGGAGMIHPNVLKAVNIDPEKWSGFAFGMGVERLAMLDFGVSDIRAFYENDVRVLRQF
ncbi:MAG TPA: phenylalanine--tRNA ligase subunit alpha [Elusimicrobiales bacterium]|nr:phenylalanine--tRNA ligase subunit alpha [Elusimicrobiales bacterium]